MAQLEFARGHYRNFIRSCHPYFIGSCDGILCLAHEFGGSTLVRLWNPSIRKFKELPSLEEQRRRTMRMYGFGYDLVSNNYKVVFVFDVHENDGTFSNEVEVHTLGTNSWKSILGFQYEGKKVPGNFIIAVQHSGQCLSGTINWLVYEDIRKNQCFIISLDLGNESFEEVLMPEYGEGDEKTLQLSVFRNSLCLISGKDVWVMKEYGNNESWTKLFAISFAGHLLDQTILPVKAIHIFEDDQVLLKLNLIGPCTDMFKFYHYKNGTRNITILGNKSFVSLISPCTID